jgi:hypothetical protein
MRHDMTGMKSLAILFALGALVAVSAAPAQARRGDQDAAFAATRQGSVRPLRDIESGLVPGMKRRGADYIGAEYDSGQLRYRLKFMRDGSVIWVDVDGRTGAVIGQAGN